MLVIYLAFAAVQYPLPDLGGPALPSRTIDVALNLAQRFPTAAEMCAVFDWRTWAPRRLTATERASFGVALAAERHANLCVQHPPSLPPPSHPASHALTHLTLCTPSVAVPDATWRSGAVARPHLKALAMRASCTCC